MEKHLRIDVVPFKWLSLLGIFLALSLFFSTCKSTPPPKPELPVSLAFDSIEAKDPEHLSLRFTLKIANPLPSAGRVKIASWQAELNGHKAAAGFVLENPGSSGGVSSQNFPLKPAASPAGGQSLPEQIPLRLNMDIAALAKLGLAPADNYRVNLILELDCSWDFTGSRSPVPAEKVTVSGLAAFQAVRPPEFTITAIAILKAELINTRFRVALRIDNPNPFPVELSAFSYELYGNGRLWADGTEQNVIKVPAKSSLEGSLFLIMNFINMKRDLLDQIIRLEDVNYRFAGDAQVSTGSGYLPKFKTSFDLSGYSQVFDN